MKNCYISGPISGVPNFHQVFERASAKVAALGYSPVCPVALGLPDKAPYWAHMVWDIGLLVLFCRVAYFQNGWDLSRGARKEHRIAKALFIKCIYE